MTILGICGRKGGSGKTTLAVHLAGEFVRRGRAVVVADCDIQASARQWAEPGNLPMEVRPMPLESDDDVTRWSADVRALDVDMVVLDSPPHLDAALGGVIGVSDLVLVPCAPSGLDLMAAAETVGLVREVRALRGDGGPAILVVPNRVDKRTASGRELAEALLDLDEPVATGLGHRTAFSDAFNAGEWVGDYARHRTAHREIRVLADEVAAALATAVARPDARAEAAP
jgi:chromosome partitioning protein